MKFNCDYCGTENERKKSVIERYKHNFCNKKCCAAWQLKRKKNKKTRSTVKVNCEVCGKEIEIYLSQFKKRKSKRFFCGFVNGKASKCQMKGLHGGIGSNGGVVKVVNCRHCGEELIRKYNQLKPNKDYFCNNKCQGNYLRGNNWTIQMVALNCAVCGKPIQVTKHEYKYSHTKTFSCPNPSRCYGIWFKKIVRNAAPMIKVNCDICESFFHIKMNHFNKSKNRRFACRNIDGHPSECAKKLVKKLKNEKFPAVNISCAHCGEDFILPYGRVNSSKAENLFCSAECQNNFHSTAMKGEGNPSYLHGYNNFPYPPDWPEISRKIRERDGFICHGWDCDGEKPFERLSAHHIDYDIPNCDPSNLITLCKSCHGKSNHNRKVNEWKYKTIMFQRFGFEYDDINFHPVYMIAPKGYTEEMIFSV